MHPVPKDLLSALLDAAPLSTVHAPRDARGLYGLVDHLGDLRYIGSTSSTNQTFYQRIHQRHRTGSEGTGSEGTGSEGMGSEGMGSEGMSHDFSQMYNTGRMWRERKDPMTRVDGGIAKALRDAFVLDHCRAVWIALPDTADIARLEAEVIAIAPDHAIAWNRRRMQTYDEPTDLVDATLRRLGWGAAELAAIERQRLRFLCAALVPTTTMARQPAPLPKVRVPPFPEGPFRFVALDVETANTDRGSVCQIGVACVRPDRSIETWMTHVDPQVNRWVFTSLHGIGARTVQGAPTFAEVLPVLRDALAGRIVYQHSGFDRSAVAAACAKANLPVPAWDWRDSVHVARAAWPELRGNGGHGLASLKQHLGLEFDHHDAGEDARAAAEVVLRAEGLWPVRSRTPVPSGRTAVPDAEDFDPIEECEDVVMVGSEPAAAQIAPRPIGTTQITQGNLDNSHIHLASFFGNFPADAVGGSNRASAAPREIALDWGGATVTMTDLDGAKRFFRKRGWVRAFFAQNGARAGDTVLVEETGPYRYNVILRRCDQ